MAQLRGSCLGIRVNPKTSVKVSKKVQLVSVSGNVGLIKGLDLGHTLSHNHLPRGLAYHTSNINSAYHTNPLSP